MEVTENIGGGDANNTTTLAATVTKSAVDGEEYSKQTQVANQVNSSKIEESVSTTVSNTSISSNVEKVASSVKSVEQHQQQKQQVIVGEKVSLNSVASESSSSVSADDTRNSKENGEKDVEKTVEKGEKQELSKENGKIPVDGDEVEEEEEEEIEEIIEIDGSESGNEIDDGQATTTTVILKKPQTASVETEATINATTKSVHIEKAVEKSSANENRANEEVKELEEEEEEEYEEEIEEAKDETNVLEKQEKVEKENLAVVEQQQETIQKTTATPLTRQISTEIKQETIKNQLKEIITDIDNAIESEQQAKDEESTHEQLQPQPQAYPQQHQQAPPKQQPTQQSQQPMKHPVQQPAPPQKLVAQSREERHEQTESSRTSEIIERSERQDNDGNLTTQYSTTTKTSTTVKETPTSLSQSQHQQNAASSPIDINQYIISKSTRSMSLPSPNERQDGNVAPTKKLNLQKLLTPPEDIEEILPKNRKLYASSAFYSPTLHPTVEDQVELARRISHSLSDISNQQSKGQTMYVNRKKRSVKWVHEGEGKGFLKPHQYGASATNTITSTREETKENEYQQQYVHEKTTTQNYSDKVPLKLVMDPRGQVQDFTSTRQQAGWNIDTGLLSPDRAAELVTALNAPRGKGAELFAKRRKKSEKWIVDEVNAATRSPSGVPAYNSPTTSPSQVPAYSDVGVQRVQLNMLQDAVQDKYAQPHVKMVKTPWDAALQDGHAAAAFQESPRSRRHEYVVDNSSVGIEGNYKQQQHGFCQQQPQQQYVATSSHLYEHGTTPANTFHGTGGGISTNTRRDLAYKPSIPQGWNAPPLTLNKTYQNSQQEDTLIRSSRLLNEVKYRSTNVGETDEKILLSPSANDFDQLDDELASFMPDKQQQQQQQQIKKFTNISEWHDEQFLRMQIREEQDNDPEQEEEDETLYHYNQNDQNCIEKNFQNLRRITEESSNKFASVKEYTEKNNNRNLSVFDEKQQATGICRNDANSEDELSSYTKVPVQDLISAFEKQTKLTITSDAKEYKIGRIAKNCSNIYGTDEEHYQEPYKQNYEKNYLTFTEFSDLKRQGDASYIHSHQEERNTQAQQQEQQEQNGCYTTINSHQDKAELYVPAEIPLDSYAPPPKAAAVKLPEQSHLAYSPQPPPYIYVDTPSATLQQHPQYPTTVAPLQQYNQPGKFPVAQKYSPSIQNTSPTPFNPSPLSYAKLAKFDNPSSQNDYYNNHSGGIGLRRPLAISGKVRNVSPTPFSSSATSNIPAARAYHTTGTEIDGVASQKFPISPKISQSTASALYATSYGKNYSASANDYKTQLQQHQPQQQKQQQKQQQQQHQQQYQPQQQQYNYGSGSYFVPAGTRLPPAVDITHMQSFNTAARGWNQMKDYYRPITFSTRREELPYTDF